MVQRRDINPSEANLRVREDMAARAAQRLRERTEQYAAAQAALARAQEEIIEQYSVPMRSNTGGRPPIVLPENIAQRMLQDLGMGCSCVWAGNKYGVSAEWVRRAARSGALEKMARGKMGPSTYTRDG